MPTIAYQSFNANSSSTHGLASIAYQGFTRDTNAHATGHGHQALVLPHNPQNLQDAYEGPAHLRPIEALTGPQSVNAFGAQVSLAYQNFYRAIGAMPDIMVVGEFDASDPEFGNLLGGSNVTVTPHPAKKACQSFTAISQNPVASGISPIKQGEGFVAYSVGTMVVVFVHVPNKVAAKAPDTQQFYRNIAQALGEKGKSIALFIGDTNQPSSGYSAQALNAAFGTDAYVNASGKSGIGKVDNWNVQEGGTNSTGTKMYDIAVYRSDLVNLVAGPVYISQSSGATTVTDHCGLAVRIDRR
jgi:hypothetical protein